MFAMAFDDLMRKMREKNVELKKLATVYENTPEFDAWWASYTNNDVHQNMHICTEKDGRTHTFYMLNQKETQNA